jgi:tRNA(Ile2) C34 agmatinyltransferase TiaS
MPDPASPMTAPTALLKCPACGKLYESPHTESPHEHGFRCPACREGVAPQEALPAPRLPRILLAKRAPLSAMAHRRQPSKIEPKGG